MNANQKIRYKGQSFVIVKVDVQDVRDYDLPWRAFSGGKFLAQGFTKKDVVREAKKALTTILKRRPARKCIKPFKQGSKIKRLRESKLENVKDPVFNQVVLSQIERRYHETGAATKVPWIHLKRSELNKLRRRYIAGLEDEAP